MTEDFGLPNLVIFEDKALEKQRLSVQLPSISPLRSLPETVAEEPEEEPELSGLVIFPKSGKTRSIGAKSLPLQEVDLAEGCENEDDPME
jgi:hypothetical protein